MFCTCWLRNVLRATTACNFSSLIWPAGSAPTAVASLLFDALEPQIMRKTRCFTTFIPFPVSASPSFFWLFLFSDLLSSTLLFSLTLPITAFHLSILSEVWRLNFLWYIYFVIFICMCFWYVWTILQIEFVATIFVSARQDSCWIRHCDMIPSGNTLLEKKSEHLTGPLKLIFSVPISHSPYMFTYMSCISQTNIQPVISGGSLSD